MSVLAKDILRLSDFYISHPEAATPWTEKWAQEAYLKYFHELNSARLNYIFKLSKEIDFCDGLKFLVDFGAGLGAATLTALEYYPNIEPILVEKSSVAQQLAKEKFKRLNDFTWKSDVNMANDILKKSVVVFSYSKTELQKIPESLWAAEAFIFVEPATREEGRQLMAFRENLKKNGFYIWAPCVHQSQCPLLIESKTDWCHHRITYTPTEELKKIETQLPIKNKTLTMSYLMARRVPPPQKTENLMRVIGDLLIEKGKTRVAICRNEKREFLSWLHKNPPILNPERGQLLPVPEHELKGNELRIQGNGNL